MKYGVCIEMLFTDRPFLDRLPAVAVAGCSHAEMWFTDMSYKGSPEDLARTAERCGVQITNTVIGAPDGSIGGGLTDSKNRSQWLDRTRATLDFNRRAGISATIVCTGNVIPGRSEAEMEQSVLEGLKATAALAEKAGITLLLEPLNSRDDHPGYWLTSSDRGAELCRKVGSPRLKLLFDCYHMQIMEGDLVKHIEKNLDVIGHFHSAGVPGRHEPKQGETNYPFVLQEIRRLGYRGTFGLEYLPSKEHEASLKETLNYFGS